MIAPMLTAPSDVGGYDPYRDAGDCEFDPIEASDRLRFFQLAIKRFELQQWQKDIVTTLFGWKRPDGTRRYREAFIFVPRKNGKSSLAAGLALCGLFCDREPRGQFFCAAGDLDQADLVFSMASGMIQESPALGKKCKVLASRKRIVKGDSWLRAIPADDKGAYGTEPHFVVGDELHTWPNRRLKDVLHTGTVPRPQPLELYITTAGYNFLTICGEVYTHACKVRDGVISDSAFFPAIYEAGKKDDWRLEETWKKANPNYGVSVRREYMQAECKKAIDNPAYENTFKREHLNLWTEQKTRWLKLDDWRNCRLSGEPIPEKAYIVGGLDLSSTTDVTAFCRLQKIGEGWKAEWRFYIPEDRALAIENQDRVPYLDWIRDGWVTATPGRTVDYSFVERDVLADSEKYVLQRLGYDPWNARGIERRFTAEGIECVEIRQGPSSLSAPCKELERAVISGLVDHGGNPVAEWMISNVEVITDSNGNIKPAKPEHNASGKKIDGVAALVTAIAVHMTTEEEGPSIYETPGNLSI